SPRPPAGSGCPPPCQNPSRRSPRACFALPAARTAGGTSGGIESAAKRYPDRAPFVASEASWTPQRFVGVFPQAETQRERENVTVYAVEAPSRSRVCFRYSGGTESLKTTSRDQQCAVSHKPDDADHTTIL